MEHELVLKNLGFNEKEVKVYVTTLQLGMAPVSVIAIRAGLKRTTVYDVLKKLAERGMVERFLRKKTNYYSVINPNQLYKQQQDHVDQLKAMLPQLTAITNELVHKPKITFYEGKTDVKKLYLDILNSQNNEVLNYFLPDKPFEYFGEDWVYKHHIQQRVKQGIRLKVIMPASNYMEQYKERSAAELRDFRLIEPKHLFFTNEAYVYDNKMSIFSFDEDFGLLIESADVVRMQRVMFELAWESRLLKQP